MIEYFGLLGTPDYDAEAEEKRSYWRKKQDWRFIELRPADLNQGIDYFQDVLCRRLKTCGISCRRLPEEEIWKRIRDRTITRFAKMTRTFVERCRVAVLTPAKLQNQIDKHTSLSDIEATFLRMAATVFSAYLAHLSAEGEEDFSGLLERAVTKIEYGQTIFDRKSGRGDLSKMRFILVDEFQDFSPLFLCMLQAARRHNPEMQVFCVGDDWQAINAFAGSDIQYFERFDEHFPPATRLSIATNYRSAPCIVELGNRLMKGRGIAARPGKDHIGAFWSRIYRNLSPALSNERSTATLQSHQLYAASCSSRSTELAESHSSDAVISKRKTQSLSIYGKKDYQMNRKSE